MREMVRPQARWACDVQGSRDGDGKEIGDDDGGTGLQDFWSDEKIC